VNDVLDISGDTVPVGSGQGISVIVTPKRAL
jgi:hypothetical protein